MIDETGLSAIDETRLPAVVGFFEWWSESTPILEKEGAKHYMRGGKPGCKPRLQTKSSPIEVPSKRRVRAIPPHRD